MKANKLGVVLAVTLPEMQAGTPIYTLVKVKAKALFDAFAQKLAEVGYETLSVQWPLSKLRQK